MSSTEVLMRPTSLEQQKEDSMEFLVSSRSRFRQARLTRTWSSGVPPREVDLGRLMSPVQVPPERGQ
jgi:hypothetical protein